VANKDWFLCIHWANGKVAGQWKNILGRSIALFNNEVGLGICVPMFALL
jgi:hypothetical protein